MTRRREKPATSPAGAAAEAERRERLAAALRQNLRRRKAQKRGREDAAEPEASAPLEERPPVK
jgi:hypothetical protein